MTSEIAENLGWPRRTAYRVLNGLTEEGETRTKKPEVRRVIRTRMD
nr:helix-turn-helix domain-containing protein [Haladaptatus salinisoli]